MKETAQLHSFYLVRQERDHTLPALILTPNSNIRKMKSVLVAVLTVGCLLIANVDAAAKRDRNNKPYKVVCYHGTWSVYRPGAGKFQVEDIDVNLCTHIIYTFVGLNNDRIRVLDGYLDLVENWGKGNMKRFNDLKKKNPNLTTILAIGGWNEGSVKYSAMARDPAKRKTFVDSVVEMLLKHDFDGLDMDWEYPANRGGIPEDKENFVALLRDLRAEFDPHGFLLTAAVSAGKATIDPAYNIREVSRLLDFINVMAYDFHGKWETQTGHHSPLYARPDEQGNATLLNMDWSIQYWIANGAPREKLILGTGTYGRSFTLRDPKNNGLGAPAPSAGRAGPFTREPGTLGFNEICAAQKREQWNVQWGPHHMAPYASKDNQWVGYDDVESIAIKTDYSKKQGLGGVMIWSIETDDFKGECFGEKYPLLAKINYVLSGGVVQPPTIPPIVPTPSADPSVSSSTASPSTTSTTTRSPVTHVPGELACSASGLFRNPKDCNRYYQCLDFGGSFTVIEFECGVGTVFDQTNSVCAWPNDVPECREQTNLL